MKFKRTFYFIALTVLLCICLLPAQALAAGDEVVIEQLQRVYTLQSDGSALVTYTATARLSPAADSISWLLGDISSAPEDLRISLDGHELINRNAEGYDRDNDLYNYKTTSSSDGVSILCSFPQARSSVSVECSYTIQNALTLYQDAAVLDAMLLDGIETPIQTSETTVVLPETVDPSLIDAFWDDYHLSVSPRTDGKTLTIVMQDMPSGTQVTAQVTMPVSLFEDAPNNIRRQSTILDDLSKTRDRELTYINYSSWFTARQGRVVLVSLIAAVLLGFLTRIRRRRHRPMSVPASAAAAAPEMSVMQFSALMHFYRRYGKKRLARNALYGTLISLVERGILSVYPVENAPSDCMLVYTPWEGCKTTGDENILLLLLFEDIGHGESSITLSQIRKYTRLLPGVVSSAMRHMNDYAVSEMTQAHQIEFFRFVKLPLNWLFQAVFLLGAVCMAFLQCWFAALAMLVSVFLISIFGRDRLHRLSQSGEDLYAHGKAFRHHLIACTRDMPQENRPALSWWASVMGYAAAIGLMPYLTRTLPSLYPQLNEASFAQENEGSVALWGLCAAASAGPLATSLWRISCILLNTQHVIEQSSSEK